MVSLLKGRREALDSLYSSLWPPISVCRHSRRQCMCLSSLQSQTGTETFLLIHQVQQCQAERQNPRTTWFVSSDLSGKIVSSVFSHWICNNLWFLWFKSVFIDDWACLVRDYSVTWKHCLDGGIEFPMLIQNVPSHLWLLFLFVWLLTAQPALEDVMLHTAGDPG